MSGRSVSGANKVQESHICISKQDKQLNVEISENLLIGWGLTFKHKTAILWVCKFVICMWI